MSRADAAIAPRSTSAGRRIRSGLLAFVLVVLPGLLAVPGHAGDAIRVTLDPSVAPQAARGRVIVFLVSDTARRLARAEPIDGPFFTDPQPIASIAVEDLVPGGTVTLDDAAVAWPVPIGELDGRYRMQAVFRCSPVARSHAGPGNVTGPVAEVELAPDRDDTVDLALDRIIEEPPLPEDDGIAWVDIRSERLSAFHGREVRLRAGVVFPPGYHDVNHPRRVWPTIYVVPGFGGTHRGAIGYWRMMRTPGAEQIAPQAVHVVLDPDARLGHHGFADSANHGPVGTALVEELIPYLEERFRLEPRAEARIVTGHSSGGWSSLWLQLAHPEVFGACWSSAPDPVDFGAFQLTDLYRDPSIFVDASGAAVPSYRWPVGPDLDKVLMTVAQEIGMERAMAPAGDSGEQWDAWAAMFSSRSPATGLPRRPWNPETGELDNAMVERDWSSYDIARRIAGDWDRYGPILRDRVRLACGTRDSFYLNRAVERLQRAVWERQGCTPAAPAEAASGDAGVEPPPAKGASPAGPPAELPVLGGPGYIWLVPHASHETIVPITTLRWNQEMIEHLRRAGLHD